jgi:magnesium chelatase family protein
MAAREAQRLRFAGDGIFSNAEMGNRQIERYCRLDKECQELLVTIMERTGLSMRAYFRIIKVARTIADLEGCADIRPAHISEAAAYRFLDRTPGARF